VCSAAAPQAEKPTSSPTTTYKPASSTAQVTVDLTKIQLPTSDESDDLLRIRHSCAHIMAMAMQRVHRGTQVTIGPWTERGFYYDFDMSKSEKPFTEAVLKKVRKEMRRIIRKDMPFIREEVTPEEARKRINDIGEPYKLEILDSILERFVDSWETRHVLLF
jgi:threonyl-tRNA synthetase